MNINLPEYKTLTPEALRHYLQEELGVDEKTYAELYRFIRHVVENNIDSVNPYLTPYLKTQLDSFFRNFVAFIMDKGNHKLQMGKTEEDKTLSVSFFGFTPDHMERVMEYLHSVHHIIIVTDIKIEIVGFQFTIQVFYREEQKQPLKIVFEGMDGGGKRTQSELLSNYLGAEIHSFPQYDTITGKLVKTYLTNPNITQRDMSVLENVKMDSLMYSLDRIRWNKNHTFDDNRTLIFDRYFTSNILYQTMYLSDDDMMEYVKWLYELEVEEFNLPKPDMVFCLIADPAITMKHVEGRGREIDKFENYNTQKIIYNNAIRIAKHIGWILIDVMDENGEMYSKEQIHEKILKYIL